MATIGLYDIDFNHGAGFSLSLPLMKAYAGLMAQGHQVIMMKPYENTGRFNKIFYFKDSPRLAVPKKLVIPTDKDTKMLGYGFYKTSNLSTQEIIETPPSFAPYDLCSTRIKNKAVYKSIKANSLIDWREKDFTGAHAGAGKTYVNDRDFLDNPDWEEVFEHYDNDVEFVHTIRGERDKLLKFIEKPYGASTRIVFPLSLDVELMRKASEYRGITFEARQEETMLLFMEIMISKILDIKIPISTFVRDQFYTDLLNWNKAGRISFKEFMGVNWNPNNYLNFPYRILLSQNPTKITYDDLVEEYLVK